MPTYKNIKIKKKGGGTRLQRVQVLASGKYKFVKNRGSRARASTKSKKKRSKSAPRKKSTKRRKTAYDGGRRVKKSKKLTHGKIMGMLAAGGEAIRHIFVYSKTKESVYLTRNLPQYYTGINFETGEFEADYLVPTYGGIAVREGEKCIFKALGMKEPTLNPKTPLQFMDLGIYHGGAIVHAMRSEDPQEQHRLFHEVEFGVNLDENGLECFRLREWASGKVFPYVLYKKLLRPMIAKYVT